VYFQSSASSELRDAPSTCHLKEGVHA
jgi:hypothetical protein